MKIDYHAFDKTKLRSFQIRLNLKSIITRAQSFGFEIVEGSLCTYHKREPETLMYLFYEYKIVTLFWNNEDDWISSTLLIDTALDKQQYASWFRKQRQILTNE